MKEKSQEELEMMLRTLRQKDLPPREVYRSIQAFGEMNFQQARQEVERYLWHEDPELRMVALKVLTRYWQLPQHWQTARAFLEQDPDRECRMKGANALAYLKTDTQDEPTLRVLAEVVRNREEHDLVRQSAYAAMHAILHYSPKEHFRLIGKDMDLEKEVDWELVSRYR
jgi:hypothetical protein